MLNYKDKFHHRAHYCQQGSQRSQIFLFFTLLWISYLLFFRSKVCMKLSLNKINQFFYWNVGSQKVSSITSHSVWYFWSKDNLQNTPFSSPPPPLRLVFSPQTHWQFAIAKALAGSLGIQMRRETQKLPSRDLNYSGGNKYTKVFKKIYSLIFLSFVGFHRLELIFLNISVTFFDFRWEKAGSDFKKKERKKGEKGKKKRREGREGRKGRCEQFYR